MTFTSTLETKTRQLLENRPRSITYAHISEQAAAHGETITVTWLTTFASTPSKGFSVIKVELLYFILTGRTLEL